MDRKKIGRYEILGELGRGAMGAVLRARDPAMGREVALKCILSTAFAGDLIVEFRQRFYREARAAGALAHPGIVPVFDVGEDDGVPFLVMELVQGRTLDAALRQGERYSLERVCEIGQQIAEAIGYAHRNGVIHRDIKPANILMTSREIYGAERPRITDFGVAKLAGCEATTTGQLLGTPAFMPPEQFTGGAIDGRTDLFALGVILYRMTTGEQPFPGETLTAVSYKVVHTEPIAPSKLNPAIPKRLEAVILRCLAKSATDRYRTGEELAADLQAVKLSPRLSGQYVTVTDATVTRGSVAETIDQVASLRPAAASTVPATPTAVSTTQRRPVIAAAPAPVPAPASLASTAVRAAPTPLPRTARASLPESSMMSTRATRGATIKHSAEPTPARKRGGMGVFAWLTLIAVGVGGTWLFLQIHVQQAPLPGADPAESVITSGSAAAAVDFNPKTLDPSTNARLAFDLDALPSALSVTVQMDGKTYWSGIAGDHDSYHGLMVPPGRHTLRVVVSGGGTEKASGNIAGDFAARKKMTLTVKLWPQNNGTLDPSSDVVISLERSLFSL
jgi:eukaryotic-like serine/threonine-protein kinase